jgi:hypothetical protein
VNGASNSMKLNLYIYQFHQRSVPLNGVRIPPANTAKYLGMTLDAKLRWKAHIKKKHQELQNSEKCTGCSNADPNCQCTISCPYRTKCCDQYGHMVPNCGDVLKKRYIDITERYQNKVLRCLVNAPWYARNSNIHRDLGVETVASIIARHAISHGNRLQHHVNEEASRLLNVQHFIRRLKRTKPFELVNKFDN